MPDVLIVADTVRSPELRHEVPLAVPDPFLYAEVGGKRSVVVSSLEAGRIEELGTGPRGAHARGRRHRRAAQARPRLVRARRGAAPRSPAGDLGLERAPSRRRPSRSGSPTTCARTGSSSTADQRFFDERRRVKTEHELAGIRRACRAVEAGIAVGVEMLRERLARRTACSRSTASRSPASGSSSRSSARSASTAPPPTSSSSRTARRPRSATTAAPARSPPTTSSSSTSSRATASRPATPTSRARSRSARRPTSCASTTGSRRRRSTSRSPPSSRA